MALSKVDYNSMNVTPAASKAIKFNSSNNGLETGDIGGNLVLISTQTVTNSGNITFDSGFTSTYKEFIFKLIDIHPAATGADYTFQVDTSGNTNYNQTITSTHFRAFHNEAGNTTSLAYSTSHDLAQSTSAQILFNGVGAENDESCAGTLHIFNPTSTTFVKHFMFSGTQYQQSDYNIVHHVAGYVNTTTALDKITFFFSSGNQAGTIKMYGVL